MKLKLLALCTLAFSLPSHAIYNLYNDDGRTFDIHGEVNVQAKKTSDKLNVLKDGAYYEGTAVPASKEELSDKRVRLGSDDGTSWLEFRGAQKLNNGIRATGVVGFGFTDTKTGGYLDTAYLAVDKKDLGSVSIGRQFLHTGYVPRTSTFNTLDAVGRKSVRLDYTGVKGLHISGYYNAPEVDNKDTADNEAWQKGYGASASFISKLDADSSLRFAVGATQHQIKPKLSSSHKVAKDTKGVLGSVEYKNGRYLAAADLGQENLSFDNTRQLIEKQDSKFAGVKVGVELTPQIVVMAGYGKNKVTTKHGAKAGETAAKVLENMNAQLNKVDLYDKKDISRAYVRADYYARESVRFYGRADLQTTKYSLFGKEYIKHTQPEYRVGVTLSF